MINKQYFVRDLANSEGLAAESLFLLTKKEHRRTKNNTPFLSLVLKDKTGEIGGKVWSDSLNNVKEIEIGDVAKVEFVVQEYQGKKELVVKRLEKVEPENLEDFQTTDTLNIDELKLELAKRIDSVRDFHLRKLLDKFFNDEEFKEEFINAPAASRVHHAYRHGLLQHTLEIVSILEGVAKIYSDINKDLLFTGALLHDIGKIKEYSIDVVGNITRLAEGNLLGHIAIGVQMIEERLPEDFPAQLRTHLLHLILSHQGKLETGSPIVPCTCEAFALYYADLMSTFLNTAYHSRGDGIKSRELNSNLEQFSEYNKYLGTGMYLGE